MRLVLTEKPSVARDLARVLGSFQRKEGYLQGEDLVITWCVGHLVELDEPGAYDPAWKSWRLDTLPMVPEQFSLRPRKGARDQWKVVKGLLGRKGFDAVINACDAGREGELIFRYCYDLAGCRLPVQRFWVSSLTDQAISEGWADLKPGEAFDHLADAARCRSEADWLVGLNMTRALTVRTRDCGGDALWSVGRVQTPTLAMIVRRDQEIAAFVPETYWQVKGSVGIEGNEVPVSWSRTRELKRPPKGKQDDTPSAQRLSSAEEAEALVAAAKGQPAVVDLANHKERTEAPPLLYDLTALQRRANQRYGLSAQRTLEVAQALYEKHKVLTYPRTDARYLTPDQVQTLPGILRAVGRIPVYAPFAEGLLQGEIRPGKRVVNAAEVGDHHAILPTDRPVSGLSLSGDEKRIYDLVARRLMAALSPDAVIATSELVFAVTPKEQAELPADVSAPLWFRAKGRVVKVQGWRAVDPPSNKKDKHLPVLSEGQQGTLDEAEANEAQTRPPKPHDDASILDAMEKAGRNLDDASMKRAMRSAGLGTPATRAAILQTLLDRKYVRREGKALRATDKGIALVDMLPAKELLSAELTGRWEARLSTMVEGQEARPVFMSDVAALVGRLVGDVREADIQLAEGVVPKRKESPAIGPCPVCETPVRKRGPVYTCDTGRSCAFVVFETMSGRKISGRMVKTLLKDRRTDPVKGFKSKRTGKAFEAGLVVQDDGRVGFWFPDRHDGPSPGGPQGQGSAAAPPSGGAPAASPAQPAASVSPGQTCPACQQGTVIRGRTALGCSRWREGCGFRQTLPAQAH